MGAGTEKRPFALLFTIVFPAQSALAFLASGTVAISLADTDAALAVIGFTFLTLLTRLA